MGQTVMEAAELKQRSGISSILAKQLSSSFGGEDGVWSNTLAQI